MTTPPTSGASPVEHDPEAVSSPTGTIRNVSAPSMSPVMEAFSEDSTPFAGPSDGAGLRATTVKQQDLGMGRPAGGPEVVSSDKYLSIVTSGEMAGDRSFGCNLKRAGSPCVSLSSHQLSPFTRW